MDLRPDRDDHPTPNDGCPRACVDCRHPRRRRDRPACADLDRCPAGRRRGDRCALADLDRRHPGAARRRAIRERVDDAEVPTFQLSMTAVLASAGAAVCAAILGSQLGVAGTLLGAALGAVVSMTAAAVFSHSLRVARNQLHRTIVTGGSLRLRPALAGVGGSAAARHEHVATTRLASASAHDRSASSVRRRSTERRPAQPSCRRPTSGPGARSPTRPARFRPGANRVPFRPRPRSSGRTAVGAPSGRWPAGRWPASRSRSWRSPATR